MRINPFQVIPLLLVATLIASCSDIGITKRLHRPGFYVDVGKSNASLKPREKAEEQTRRRKKVGQLDSREPLLTAQVAEVVLEREQKKISSVFLSEIQKEEEYTTKDVKLQSLNQTAREITRKMRARSILDWSLLAIIAFSISALGLVLLITAIALLIHGATLKGGEQVKFQKPGYHISIATLLLGLVGFVSGLVGLKDVKSRMVRSKAMAILAIVFGAVVMAISLIPALVFMAFGGYQ